MNLKNFAAVVNGNHTVLRLTEEEAQRRGLTEVGSSTDAPAPKAAPKRGRSRSKAATATGTAKTPANKAQTAANKAQTPENKGAPAADKAVDDSTVDRGF